MFASGWVRWFKEREAIAEKNLVLVGIFCGGVNGIRDVLLS